MSGEPIETVSSAITVQNLQEGDYLFQGQNLVASLCYFRLAMQGDGNLVVYGWAGAQQSNLGQRYRPSSCRVRGCLRQVTKRRQLRCVFVRGNVPCGRPTPRAHPARGCRCRTTGTWCFTPDRTRSGPRTQRDRRLPGTAPKFRGRRRRGWSGISIFRRRISPEIAPQEFTGYASWCGVECGKRSNCEAWTFVPRPADYSTGGAACWLKSAIPTGVTGPLLTSGYKVRP